MLSSLFRRLQSSLHNATKHSIHLPFHALHCHATFLLNGHGAFFSDTAGAIEDFRERKESQGTLEAMASTLGPSSDGLQPSSFLFLVVMPGATSTATSSFMFLGAMHLATSSVLVLECISNCTRKGPAPWLTYQAKGLCVDL